MAFTNVCQFSSLTLNRLRLKVHLGCGAEERKVSQFVFFDIRVRFSSPPAGCLSDELKDTLCYAELSDRIRAICAKQEFRLIEHLGWMAYQELKEFIPRDTQLLLRVTKEKPPVDDLEGGASFTMGDWIDH